MVKIELEIASGEEFFIQGHVSPSGEHTIQYSKRDLNKTDKAVKPQIVKKKSTRNTLPTLKRNADNVASCLTYDEFKPTSKISDELKKKGYNGRGASNPTITRYCKMFMKHGYVERIGEFHPKWRLTSKDVITPEEISYMIAKEYERNGTKKEEQQDKEPKWWEMSNLGWRSKWFKKY